MQPSLVFQDRPSDSPLIERVWRSRSERAGTFQSIAACHWEMVVVRHDGRTSLIVRGPETRATMADFPAHGEWFAIRFRLGSFMPLLRPGALRDRNDVMLPDAASRSFWLNGSAWDYPTFENAETFVKRLANAGLVAEDRLVGDSLHRPARQPGTRTEQRRFLQVTGLTRGAIRLIERARQATLLLKLGVPILDAAFEAGYYDQAHFTRSLKRWIGQTPAQVVRAERQLSFLYKTDVARSAMFRPSHS
ncbi:MAG TPA: AraC family transcriptional regulator [Candidatus Polarisedimenticolia bacterium]|nr:AraC family transcriptional regulator [Candidatus Polarisedimenticolia bacterium]